MPHRGFVQHAAGVRGRQKHRADPIGHASTTPLVQVLLQLGYSLLTAPPPRDPPLASPGCSTMQDVAARFPQQQHLMPCLLPLQAPPASSNPSCMHPEQFLLMFPLNAGAR